MKATLRCFLVLCSAAFAQQTPEHNVPGGETIAKIPVIGRGDLLSIHAFECEEISRQWRVSELGELGLPLLGRVKAAGLTTSGLERDLASRLAKYIREPQVAVFITETRKYPVTVTGAVGGPGTVMLQDGQSLFDAIVVAGGLKEAGTKMTVTRSAERGPIPIPQARQTEDARFWVAEVELEQVMNARSGAASLVLAEDDVVAVEARQPKLVHIIGEVPKPGSVELVNQDSVSLMKLLAAAGGLTRLASPKKIVIRHIGEQGAGMETAVIDLRKVMSGEAADLELSPGDVVIVPSSNFKMYMQTVSVAAVNSGIFSGLQVLARF